MKKLITFIAIFCSFNSAFAQNELIERLEKQAVEIDSLKKISITDLEKNQKEKNENNNLKDTLKKLRSDFANLDEFRKLKQNIDILIGQKTDSIKDLKAIISEKDKQIATEKQNAENKANEGYEKGKYEILTIIVNKYKNQSFDDLLISSSKQSIGQDLLICKDLPESSKILSDLNIYYNAKELLENKIDINQIKNQLMQLGLIKRKSLTIDKLKEIISNYQTFDQGLKETIEKIISLDKREVVAGMSNEIQKKKLDKILGEVSSYIFNYDFNLTDYPYLSGIILELIKIKQPNADADISDLLKKL